MQKGKFLGTKQKMLWLFEVSLKRFKNKDFAIYKGETLTESAQVSLKMTTTHKY